MKTLSSSDVIKFIQNTPYSFDYVFEKYKTENNICDTYQEELEMCIENENSEEDCENAIYEQKESKYNDTYVSLIDVFTSSEMFLYRMIGVDNPEKYKNKIQNGEIDSGLFWTYDENNANIYNPTKKGFNNKLLIKAKPTELESIDLEGTFLTSLCHDNQEKEIRVKNTRNMKYVSFDVF